jgi:Leucine-rich repeat (LRR) protein
LTCLDLSGTVLPEAGLAAIGGFIARNRQICEVSLNDLNLTLENSGQLMDALAQLDGMTKLNLGNNFLEDVGAEALAASLQHCFSLQELDLNMNQLTARGAEVICSLVSPLPRFELLTLAQNQIAESARRRLFELFPNLVLDSVN